MQRSGKTQVLQAPGPVGYDESVRVDVLYFGMLKDYFGGERDVVELADASTVAELLRQLRGRATSDMPVWDSLAVAVNRDYAGLATVLADGDEVALLPPVSGGVGHAG